MPNEPLQELSLLIPHLIVLKPNYMRCILDIRNNLIYGLGEVEVECVEVGGVYAFRDHLDGGALPIMAETTERLRSLHE